MQRPDLAGLSGFRGMDDGDDETMTTPDHPPTLVDLAARVRAGGTAPYSDLAAAVVQAEERLRALAEEWRKRARLDSQEFYFGQCADELLDAVSVSNARPDKRSVGLKGKFRVERADGDPTGKHQGCRYFVLDVDHDPHAIPALHAYAASCEADGYGLLAADLRALLGEAAR